MASHDPASSLPIYYGEMTSHGTVVKRYDGESIDRPLTPLQRNLATPLREKPTSMPPEEPSSSKLPPEKRQRWSADDFRRGHGDDYWLPGPGSYWERKRWERDTDRGRDWYPEYRRPEQYIEYDGPPGMMRTSGSRREGEIKQVYRRRRGSWDGAPPPPPGPRRRNPYSDDEYEEEYYPKERRGPRKRAAGGGGREPPPKDDDSDKSGPKRLPYTKWMGMQAKNHFVATIGEFVGTTMFLFFAFAGTQVANIGSRSAVNSTTGQETGFSPDVLLYIALVFGFSLMVNVWVFFRISGGLFNPAVTLGMALTGAITTTRACLLVVAQVAGSIFASFLVKVMFPTKFNVRTTLSKDTSAVRGVFIEAILTAELVFTIFMLAKEKHKATFIAPVGIGLALFIAELVGVEYTGGSLNPARSFGPCVVSSVFDREHWIYWVGPGAGAIAAVLFYKFILILQYEMANPGQDEDSEANAETAAELAARGVNPHEVSP